MIAEESFEKLTFLLKKHDQGHILAFCDQLNTQQREGLMEQIEQLDLCEIDKWVENYVKRDVFFEIPANLEPAPVYPAVAENEEQSRKYCQAKELGEKLISQGKVAAFVVAGGQGTRLGFDGPKGDFSVSPVKNKTLFRIFAENIKASAAQYDSCCPWYIMTSPLNYHQTVDIFRANSYYGLNETDVFIFQQGTVPNFGFDGRILMADKGVIATSPDGHGGSLKALYNSGATEDMKRRGVEYISYFQVDNPLIDVFDLLFIGLHAIDEAQMSSKAVIKTGPMEKVGNFCLVDGRVAVIEYSDLPDEQARRCNADGSLVFKLGSIAIHIISRSFVEELNDGGFSLPVHRAVKKISHLDENGQQVVSDEPNGIKLETFVFDALSLAKKSIILETLRDEEFGPVKNASGVDSAETARQMIVDRAGKWLEAAGVLVPRKEDGSLDCVLEISPCFALSKDDVKAKAGEVPEIKSGDEIYLG